MTKLASLRASTKHIPLRTQLMFVVLVLVMAALVIVGLTAASALRNSLLERVDTQLVSTARDELRRETTTGLATHPGRIVDDVPLPAGGRGPALVSGFYTKTLDRNGNGVEVLRVPEGSNESAPELPELTTSDVNRLANKPFTVDSEDGSTTWRLIVYPNSNGTGGYVSGVSLNDVNETVGHLNRTITLVSLVVLAVLGFLGYALIHSRLRNLVEVEQTAERIAAGDLSQRVPNSDAKTEVGRVATAINQMLSRIEESFQAQQASENEARESEARMRRFVADASHELRTPLTSIRGFAELSRSSHEEQITAPDALVRIEGEAKRMSGLVEDLLILARLDQQRPLAEEPVDLYDVVADAVRDAPATGPNHKVILVADDRLRTTPTIVIGDDARLRQVLANLLMNAYTHTPAGTEVEVRLRADGDTAVLEVADNGPGMDTADAARVFERFYRSDPSRTRASGGSGLGLSIVAGLIGAQGGTVDVETAPGQGARFIIRLPLIPADED